MVWHKVPIQKNLEDEKKMCNVMIGERVKQARVCPHFVFISLLFAILVSAGQVMGALRFGGRAQGERPLETDRRPNGRKPRRLLSIRQSPNWQHTLIGGPILVSSWQ